VAGHRLEGFEVTAADGAENRVVGEAGAVGDLVGGQDVAARLGYRHGAPVVLFRRVRCPDDRNDRVWFVSHGAPGYPTKSFCISSSMVISVKRRTSERFSHALTRGDQPNMIVVS
jgi:hypothetical protein